MNGGDTVCKGCFIEKMTETNTYAKKSFISPFLFYKDQGGKKYF